MSCAWEVTVEDVQTVLNRHKSKASAEKLHDEHFVGDGRVEEAVLHYVSMEVQIDAALSEIEDVLLEEKVISGEKLFTVDDSDDEWESDFDDDEDEE